MHRTSRVANVIVLTLAAAAALPLAGCGDEEAAKAREAELREKLSSDIDKTRKDLERTSQDLRTTRDDARTLRETVAELQKRVAALEERPAAAASAAAVETSGPAIQGKSAEKERAERLAEVKALQAKVFDGTATDDEQTRFWELARTTGVVDDIMRALEAKVKDAPDDADLHMQLGQAYITKLLSVPPGPEQGVWSQKAEREWQAVLKKDPEHWDARFSVAFNWSMWPDFLNKTPDAVREFEKLREIQERQASDAKHGQTYLHLARLYQKQGKQDKAKETLRAGLARHADDAELKKALDALAE